MVQRVRSEALHGEELRWTLEEVGICFWSLDVPTGRVTVSPSGAQLFGVSPERLTTFEASQDLVHPDDREPRARAIQRALERGGAYEVDYRVVRPDGETDWLRSRGIVEIDPEGGPVRHRGVVVQHPRAAPGRDRSCAPGRRSALDPGDGPRRDGGHRRGGPDPVLQRHGRAPVRLRARGGGGPQRQPADARALSQPARFLHGSLPRHRRAAQSSASDVSWSASAGTARPSRWSSPSARCARRARATSRASSATSPSASATETRLQELQSELVHMSRFTALGEMASTLAHEINQPLTAIASYLKGCRRPHRPDAGRRRVAAPRDGDARRRGGPGAARPCGRGR